MTLGGAGGRSDGLARGASVSRAAVAVRTRNYGWQRYRRTAAGARVVSVNVTRSGARADRRAVAVTTRSTGALRWPLLHAARSTA